ncbi:hypothetical protein ACS0Y7_35360, partial [Burkholderia gladioli]|uniref:hypothetical protein n=1 Tax=Burkholderia gladioli TaxID=28095 RepID=UPI003F79BC14
MHIVASRSREKHGDVARNGMPLSSRDSLEKPPLEMPMSRLLIIEDDAENRETLRALAQTRRFD